MLHLYNTLTRKKELLKPRVASVFNMYTCGPTVYRDAHIGNLRSYLMADWIRRVLIASGFDVIHVKNITDVGHMRQEVLEQGEDKVIAAAIAEGKTPAEIAEFYTNRFLADESTLNILPVDHLPRATDHVPEMVGITESLLEGNLAYEVDGNVYFSVERFPDYGKLSGNIHESQLQEAVRVEADPRKRDPRDFTLWKVAEPGRTLKWPSPWGDGFPGWHIECSAMSMKYFGKKFDIHTGGVDNIFPHHEGEIAQSEGVTGDSVVSYWIHGQHLLADGVKMAKSSGNAFIVADLEERGIDPLAFRYLCMTARYSTRLNFTFTSLKAAENALNKLRRLYVLWGRDSQDANRDRDGENSWWTRFIAAINDDLNLPVGLDIIWRITESELPNVSKRSVLTRMDEILGLSLKETPDMFDVPQSVNILAQKRDSHRKNQEFSLADSLREKMGIEGYSIEDGTGTFSVRLKNRSELREEKWPAISSSSEVPSALDSPSEFEYSVGIVANGYPDDAERCLRSIDKYSGTLSKEILLLDNGNHEGVGRRFESLQREIESLAVIHADHALGDGAAKNSLLKSAKGNVFILIDPSVEAIGPFLSELGNILSDPKIGIAGYAGLRTETMLHFHEGDGESGYMDAMQGYCLAFRRGDITNVGLMRESFRFYRNLDIDFSFQFKNVGFRIYADNSLPLVLHEHRGWTSLSEQERDELSRKNYGRFLKKWREKTDLLIKSAD